MVVFAKIACLTLFVLFKLKIVIFDNWQLDWSIRGPKFYRVLTHFNCMNKAFLVPDTLLTQVTGMKKKQKKQGVGLKMAGSRHMHDLHAVKK